MGKAPAFQFYPNDWSRDLEEHPLEIEGAWIRICCKLWWSETKGRVEKSMEQWGRILRISPEKTKEILDYISDEKIANITESNGKITIISRRMEREEKERESNRLRQRRHYNKNKPNTEPNKNLTPPSSSSSSTSKKKHIDYPSWLNKDLWTEFKKYRTKIKSPLTDHAEKLCLTELEKIRKEGFSQADIINATIMSGKWKSFYPPKNKTPTKNNKDPFIGDHFLKTAYNLMRPPYKEDDFNSHCRAFNRDPGEVRHEISKALQG